MPALFGLALFVSAALVFLVQLMIGRMLLPLLGGSPAVWNTCMVFFQAALLAGYAYSHAVPHRLGTRRHAPLHLLLFLAPLLVLPFELPTVLGDPGTTPLLWQLAALTLSVGLPFFVLATTAPLLQRWFAATTHRSAGDPYFLYAASNLGSMLALVAYPFLIEPWLTLTEQRRLWTFAYVGLGLLIALCALCLTRSPRPPDETTATPAPPLSPLRKLRWVLLAFVPSSLLLSVTSHLTMDLAAIPLFWVAPLALYLLTFVLAFARRRWVSRAVLARGTPLAVIVLVLVLLLEATEPVSLLIGLHLAGFFWLSLFCHAELAADRPPPGQLTAFYLWMSLGGVLGGLFNALLAPVLFRTLVEYPLVLVLVALLRVRFAQANGDEDTRTWRRDVAWAVGIGAATVLLVLLARGWKLEPGPVSVGVMFAVPAIVCYACLGRPMRFALGVGALLLASALYPGVHGEAQVQRRSFFGAHRVTIDPTGDFRVLVHGNTVHGMQRLSDCHAPEPLSYYHREGPAGRVFRKLKGDPRLERVGVVGLGCGSLAAYAEPGQHWTFFEIDPVVIELAGDPRWFTFLSNCPATIRIVQGDGRLELARSGEKFGVLVIDAFSSDAIPVHLLTREALAVYRSRLRPDGVLLFNISNRYIDLKPVLADLARDANPPMACYDSAVVGVTDDERKRGKAACEWVLMVSGKDAIQKPLVKLGAWSPVHSEASGRPWTDDFSNPIRFIKWAWKAGRGD